MQSLTSNSPFLEKFRLNTKSKLRSYSQTAFVSDKTYVAKKDQIEGKLWQHHIVEANMNIQSKLKVFHALAIKQKIPQFYSYYFDLQIVKAKQSRIEDQLDAEIEKIKQRKSHYHTIMNFIRARQGCLKQLALCLEKIVINKTDTNSYNQFKEQIKHYRILTHSVVKHIQEWKNHLRYISQQDQFIVFMLNDEDYLKKLLNDNQFIANSFLSRHLRFNNQNDPFFIRPWVQSGEDKYKELFVLTEQQKQSYIEQLNFLAEQRALQLKKNVQFPMQNRVKRIKQIYQSKNIKTRLIFNKKDISLSRKLMSPVQSRKQENQLINTNLLNNFSRKLKFKPDSLEKSNLNSEAQFMIRKKQMQALQDINLKGKMLKPLVRKEERRLLQSSKGIQQLQNIFKILQNNGSDPNDSLKLSRMSNSKPLFARNTLLQHNQELVVSLRNSVIKQIEQEKKQQKIREQQSQRQKDNIMKILNKKIDQQVLKSTKAERQSKFVGRKQLIQDMKASQIFDQEYTKQKLRSQKFTKIQQELKRQMQLKLLRDVQEDLKKKTQMIAYNQAKKTQQIKISKQYQQAKRKEELQKKYSQIQREQRAKVIKKQIQLDQQRKKQIEQQMRKIIMKEKEKLDNFSKVQKMEIQQQLKEAMKIKILENLKKMRSQHEEEEKSRQKMKQQEQNYREKVKKQLEKQYKVQERIEKLKKKQEHQAKVKLVSEKLQYLDGKLNASKISKKTNTKENYQNQSKLDNIQQKPQIQQIDIDALESRMSQFPDLRASAFQKGKVDLKIKKKLREQFQCELFSFRNTEYYPQKQQLSENQFLVKDFKSIIENQEYIDKRMEELKDQKQTYAKGKTLKQGQITSQVKLKKRDEQQIQVVELKPKLQLDSVDDKFERFSNKKSEKRPIQKVQENKNEYITEQLQQQIANKLGMTLQEYKIYSKKKETINKNRDFEYQREKKQQKLKQTEIKKIIQDFELIQYEQTTQVKQNKNIIVQVQQLKKSQKEIVIPENSSQTQHKSIQVNQKKNITKKKQSKKHNSTQQKDSQQQYFQRRKKKPKRFLMSDDDQQYDDPLLVIRNQKQKAKTKKNISKKQSSQQSSFSQIQKQKTESNIQQNQVVPLKKQSEQLIKLRVIPQDKLKQFLDDHYSHLPKTVKRTNIYSKEELLKLLLLQKSFYIMEKIVNSLSLGLIIAIYDQSKKSLRRAYQSSDTYQLYKGVSSYVFKHDPCDQITFSHVYDKQIEDQSAFINNFEVKFDEIGSIFQKKIINTQFERKYVLRRSIGQDGPIKNIKQNLGCFAMNLTLAISEKSLLTNPRQQTFSKNGCYGIFSCYIANYIQQQKISKLIESQQIPNSLKHMGKTALSLKKHQAKFRDLQFRMFKSVFELNLELIKQHKPVLKCDSQIIQQENKIIFCQFIRDLQLGYSFFSTVTNFSFEDDEYTARYLRYKLEENPKAFVISSSKYSATLTALPCKNSKYKMFILSAQQYDNINKSKSSSQSLDIYIRLFFATIQGHSLAKYEHVWIPNLQFQNNFTIKESKFFNEYSEFIDRTNLQYVQYIDSSLKLVPTHRDLMVTVPFIFGILDVQLEQAVQGTPLYIRRVDINDLKSCKPVQNAIIQSD